MRWALRLGRLSLLALPLVMAALCLHAALLPEPPRRLVPESSSRLLDRSGKLIAEVRDADGDRVETTTLGELSPWVVPALLAAEDARFYSHPGIDPAAMLRAAAQALERGRVVSGASTITQQLARTLFERPRTLWGKWCELALALRLEQSFDKPTLLEAYLNRVDFGPRLRGIGAASRYYFDKPAAALSLAEAASLVSIVRGPTRYDPHRHAERLERRRDRILTRLLELGWADADAVHRARGAPLVLHQAYLLPGAFHFVRAAVRGKLGAVGDGELRTTLDGELQRQVEATVLALRPRFAEHRASAAAVVVVDNTSGAVRAYVGSPEYGARRAQGQNDGVLSLRQPGSTLKPFIYALALRDLGLNVASILPDLEQSFVSSDGLYVPHNYDRRFHGPVRLGPALAASLNVPAVGLAERLGSERVVGFLRSIGFEHLDEDARYGPGIALGVAEVQLLELAAAYAMLGRAGSYVDLRFFEGAPSNPPRRVLPASVVRQIVEILSDPRERAATFGRNGPLELDFPAAVKTGTSKGNRDNWVVGFTPELTVAVWVGNFDGSPMLHSSGATGAGPLFHAVMNAAVRELSGDQAAQAPRHDARSPESAEVRVVCALSGQLAGAGCPHHLSQRFWAGHVPDTPCRWHTSDCVDGRSASGNCTGQELLPARYSAWAHDSGRVASGGTAAEQPSNRRPSILFPRPSARFTLDDHLNREQQAVVLSAQAANTAFLVFTINGRQVCRSAAPFRCPWPLERGRHELVVRDEQGERSTSTFTVE